MAISVQTGWEHLEGLLSPQAYRWLHQHLPPRPFETLEQSGPQPSGEALGRWRAEAEERGYTGPWLRVAAEVPVAPISPPEEIQARPKTNAMPGSTAYQSMLAEHTEWGYTRAELKNILGQGGMAGATAGDASRFLNQYFSDVYGGPPPSGIRPSEWRLYPGGWQARARRSVALPKGVAKPKPEKWTEEIAPLMEKQGVSGDPALMVTRHQTEDYTRAELMASRQGLRSFFSATAITGTWPGIPGEEPGTVMLYKDPAKRTQQIKIAKSIQRGLVYPQADVWKGQGRLTKEGPHRVGPASTRPERGMAVPTVHLLEEWLPEGTMYLPGGLYDAITRRRVIDLFVPKDFNPEMVGEGRTWAKGDEIKPFAGAAPIDLGVGRGWDSAVLLDSSLEPETRTKMSGGKQVTEQGQRLRLNFSVSAGPESARLSMKSLWGKFMAPMAATERILGEEYRGYAVAETKDPTMLPFSWWYAQDAGDQAQILSSIRGQDITPAQAAKEPWQQVGREIAQYYRSNVLDKIYKEIPLHFRVHESVFRLLPKDRLKSMDPVKDMPEFWDVVTQPVPALVAESWMDIRKGYGVTRPRLPFRELRLLERVAPEIFEDVMKRARPIQEAYEAIVGGAAGKLPTGTKAVTPTTDDLASLFAIAEEKAAGAIVPESALQHALIESAAEIWGTSPIQLGGRGMLAGATHARRFTAEGIFEGEEVSRFGTAYAEALKALAGGKPEQVQQAFDRALEAQVEMAGSRKFFRSMLAAHLGPRAVGDVMYPSALLKPHEFAVPVSKVLRAYGLKVGSQEANKFLDEWQAGRIEPSALIWGHPVPGEEPFQRRIAAVHPQELSRRASRQGLKLSNRTPIQLSMVLAEALGRDFDEDLAWALFTGNVKTEYGEQTLTGHRQISGLTLKQPAGVPLATPEDILRMADERIIGARASLAMGAGLKPPPGVTPEQWAKMDPLQRIKATLDPSNLAPATATTMRESLNFMAQAQGKIGKYFNILEDVQVAARGLDPEGKKGLGKAADFLFELVHGRTQTPALLPAGLQEVMSRLSTGIATGSYLEEQQGEWKWRGRLPGLAGLRQKLVTSLMEAQAVPEDIPERLREAGEEHWIKTVAKLAFPEESYEKAVGAIERFRAGKPGERGIEWSSLAGDPEQWALNTPLGIVFSSHVARRAKGEMGISAGAEEELSSWSSQFQTRRDILSKARRFANGDPSPDDILGIILGKIEGLGKLHPELAQQAWEETSEDPLLGFLQERIVAMNDPEREVLQAIKETGTPAKQVARRIRQEAGPPLWDPEFEQQHGITRERAAQPAPPQRTYTPRSDPAIAAATELTRRFERGRQAREGRFTAPRFRETIGLLGGQGEEPGLLKEWMPGLQQWMAGEASLTPLMGKRARELVSRQRYMQRAGAFFADPEIQGRPPSQEMLGSIAQAEELGKWPGLGGLEAALSQEKMRGLRTEPAQVTDDLTERFQRLIGETDPLIGQLKEAREQFRQFGEGMEDATQGQRAQLMASREAVSRFFRGAAGIARGAEKGEFLLQEQGDVRQALGLQAAGLRGTLEEIGEQRPPGVMGRVFGGVRKLAVGWAPMQMGRAWGMLGAPVFQKQIPAAAAAEMGGWQAAQAIGGFTPGLPEGVAGGVIQYRAAQQQAMIDAGRTGYRAWGGTMQAMPAVSQAMGIAGPPAGAGLAALIGLSAVGAPLAAAGPIGLGIAGIGTAYAGAEYLRSFGAPTAENQLALTGESAVTRATLGRYLQPAVREPGAPVIMPSQRPQPSWTESQQWAEEQQRARERIRATPMGELGAQERMGALNVFAQGLRQQEDTIWAGMDEGQILQLLGQMAPYYEELQTLTPEQLETEGLPRAFETAAATGAMPGQFAPLARQLGMGTGGTRAVFEALAPLSATEQMRRTRLMEQWAPLTQFGVEGEEITRRAGAPPTTGWEAAMMGTALPELDILQQQRLQRAQQMAASAQMLGLEAPMVAQTAQGPGEWLATQAPLLQAQTGLQQQLRGLGVPTERGAGMVGTLGTQFNIQQFQRLLSGDQGMLGQLGMFNLQGGPAAELFGGGMVDVGGGLQADMGPLRQAFVDAITEGIPNTEVAQKLVGMMDELRPTIDPSTGLRVGIASMPEQLFQEALRGAVLPGAMPAMEGEAYETAVSGGTRGLQALQTRYQREYQDWQFQQQERSLDLRRVSQFGGTFEGLNTRGTFAIVQELRNLSRQWEEWTMDYQDQQRQLQYRQFMESWQAKAERLPVQFQWQREDIAYRGAQQTLQYGWGMEDIEEQMRYATGRERRGLMRRRERMTIQYGMGMGRLETDEERVNQRERWAREDMARQRRHFMERFALQEQYQGRYRQYWEQRRALEDELQVIREYNARFQLEQAEAQLGRQIELQGQLRTIQDSYIAINQYMENAAAIQQVFISNLIAGLSAANNLAIQIGKNASMATQTHTTYGVPSHYPEFS